MADQIGRITVPAPVNSGLVFPLVTDFGYSTTRQYNTVSHRFGELATLAQQTFEVGIGPRKFTFKRQVLNYQDRTRLVNFFDAVQGSFQSFQYNAPNESQGFTPYQVIFETAPLSVSDFINACSVGITFVESPDPSAAPSYTINNTVVRFPDDSLAIALTNQVQQIIPLVHVRVREAAVPDIYLSDQRVIVQGQTYLPRLLNIGEKGSDVIMGQSIAGQADNIQFTFGNADRVMTALANDTDLKYAGIDLCLYHVQSGTLLQLWKGFIQSFVSDGSSRFPVQCSDGLFPVMQQYPTRTVSRTCWKIFNDGVNCPYSTAGSGGDPTSCDFTFDGTNGCLSHTMQQFFGGVPIEPQGVQVEDNSTGVWGFGRNTVTATSIVSDTIWGQALAEIWASDGGNPQDAFITNALVGDYRDEGDFADGIGIVGQGPIGAYSGMSVQQNADGFRYIVAPEMDGQTPQGFKVDANLNVTSDTALGLREVLGADPTDGPITDPRIAISQGGIIPSDVQNRAAGTAFIDIRISTPKQAVLPTTTDQHSISVPISQGLAGYVWDYSGNRSLVPGLTNPFWIAVNCYLRALGLFNADSETQLSTFVLGSIVQPDGFSGAADIANIQVTPVIGDQTTTETQFIFNGVLATQKPFRDWLTEILSCGLGYYTFEFGKLKLGVRENASAVSAFTLGNILFQSLSAMPIEASFEHLVIDFADRAYQYQANTADFTDKDHAQYYGRAASPLTARMHSVGMSGLSQALRISVTRVREEVGGVGLAEWSTARTITFSSTILALDTEVGQVISLTHPDLPGGFGHFRIQSWKLLKDWSIQITAKSVTDSMYDLDAGPKPADVPPDSLPILYYPQPQGEWNGYQIQANENDAISPNEFTFDLAQDFLDAADGAPYPRAIATGKKPVNTYIANCTPPYITAGTLIESKTGGYLAGGLTLRVAVCAMDANGRLSPPSDIIISKTDSTTDTNQLTINGIKWPSLDGLTGYALFASDDDNLICMQQTGNGQPDSITLLGPLSDTHWAIPNASITAVRLKAKLLKNPGAVGELVTLIDGAQVTCVNLIDSAGTDDWTGRVLFTVSRKLASAPFGAWNITAFDPTTGTFTLDRPATVAHHPEQSIQVGDGIVVSYQGYDNSANPYRIEDAAGTSSYQNFPSNIPHSGLAPNANVGDILRVIWGTGRGSTAKVVGNDATGWTLDVPIAIDATSNWLIEDGTWGYTADSSPILNSQALTQSSIALPMPNFVAQGTVVGAVTVNDRGVESDFSDMPVRLFYVYAIDALETAPFPWQANSAEPNATSYLDTTDLNFDVQTVVDESGNDVAVSLMILGEAPENAYSSLPQIVADTGFTQSSGGNIKGDQDVYLTLCAVDANGGYSEPSDEVIVNIGGATDTNTAGLDMTGVAWPAAAVGWDLFAGTASNTKTHQASGAGAPTTADLTLTNLNVRTYGAPDANFDHLATSVKRLISPSAIIGQEVVAISGANVTIGERGVAATIVSNLAGARLFLVAKSDITQVIEVFDSLVVSNVGPVLTLSEDASSYLAVGDVVGLFLFADISSPNTIGCSMLDLPEATPMATAGAGLANNQVRIIGGTGEGQVRTIASNTGDTITIQGTWDVVPDASSYWVIEEPSWSFTSESSSLVTPTPFISMSASVNITSLQWDGLLVMVQTVASDGDVSAESESPKRVVWVNRLTDSFVGANEAAFIFGTSTDGGWGDIATGNITNSPKAPVAGSFIGWNMNAGVAPIGDNLVIDVLLIKAGTNTPVSIFGSGPYPTLTPGEFESTDTVFNGIATIAAGDRLRAVVLNVGSTTPGQSCTLQVYWL